MRQGDYSPPRLKSSAGRSYVFDSSNGELAWGKTYSIADMDIDDEAGTFRLKPVYHLEAERGELTQSIAELKAALMAELVEPTAGRLVRWLSRMIEGRKGGDAIA